MGDEVTAPAAVRNIRPGPAEVPGSPHSLDAERSLLGAMLVDEAAAAMGLRLVPELMFFAGRHRRIRRAMGSLAEGGYSIEPLTVAEELLRTGELEAVGGKDYISELLEEVPTAANAESHARIVQERAGRRRLQEINNQAVRQLSDGFRLEDVLRQQRDDLAAAALEYGPAPGAALPQPQRAIDVTAGTALEFLADDFLIAGDQVLIAGEDGHYKTAIMLHILCAIAGGGKIFGRFATRRPGPVLLFTGEDPAGIVVDRLRAICRGHGWNMETVLSRIYIVEPAGGNLLSAEWIAHLADLAESIRPVMIAWDPLRELTPGDEQSSNDMAPLMTMMREQAKRVAATPLVVHHAGKGSTDRRSKDRIRGSTAITSAARRTLFVEDQPGDEIIRVESIKFSRVPNPPPFMLHRYIEQRPDNPASWVSARFEYASAGEVALGRAEEFVRDQLAGDVRMCTTDLKKAAAGTGVSGADIARALKVLEMRRLVTFEEGPKGRKDWLWVVAGNSGQPRQPQFELAGQPDSLPGNQIPADPACPAPIGGRQASRETAALATKPSRGQFASLKLNGPGQ